MTVAFRKNWSWERKNWANLVNFNIWRVLKIPRDHPCFVREIIKETGISSGMLGQFVLPCLLKFGLVTERKEAGSRGERRVFTLTEDGEKVSGAFSLVGDVIEKMRGRLEGPAKPRPGGRFEGAKGGA